MRRMQRLAAALDKLCETFESLALEQQEEEKLRIRMDNVMQRVSEIDVEMQSIQRNEKLKRSANSLEESEEADELRKRLRSLQQERQTLEKEQAAAPPGIADGTLGKDGAPLGENDIDHWSLEAVQYLNVMANSHSRQVRLRTTTTVAKLAEKSTLTKEQICMVPRLNQHPMSTTTPATIIERIVELMKSGGLEAIEVRRARC